MCVSTCRRLRHLRTCRGKPGAAPAASPAPSAPVVTGGTSIPSPVAGTLLRYAVDSGASVKRGDTVIVLESMKMELEVKAPADGVVTFSVQPGTQVTAGQELGSVGGVAAAPAPVSKPAAKAEPAEKAAPVASGSGTPVASPVAGTLLKYAVAEGASVNKGDTVVILESMKMELEVKSPAAGKIHFAVATGSQVANGQTLAEVQ